MGKIEVGEWVVNSNGDVFKIKNFFDYVWCIEGKEDKFRKATAEEIIKEIRRRMFVKVDREIDEWKPNDVVVIKKDDYFHKKVVGVNGETVKVQSLNIEGTVIEEWHHKAKLTPVYFVENMVVEEI
ncbi:hypothetical protein CN306_18685 [Bacillus thuringiensis]|uniref:hypothetical protein n=1 Tax=Bacillus thuringiensis TaxID=1428 RepID=UPI000BF9AF34|nr:hypothetical protein [Bacillus thuringiensis]PFD89199.1 hypothetical protein CN306_18685 [Bacillus thuringiensis]